MPVSRSQTTVERGYDYSHKQLREQWRPQVERGEVACRAAVCLMPSRLIAPDARWDLGHTPDRSGYTGPEHARCNRSDGGRRRHSTSVDVDVWTTSRDWLAPPPD